MSDELFFALLNAAHAYAAEKRDDVVMQRFYRYDGLDIPPSTRLRIEIHLEHWDEADPLPVLTEAVKA